MLITLESTSFEESGYIFVPFSWQNTTHSGKNHMRGSWLAVEGLFPLRYHRWRREKAEKRKVVVL